jgi:gas vesicle protein
MSKVLLGFIAGAAAGALAGILFAPDKGSNTRSKIATKAGDWKEAAKESINGIIDSVKDVYAGSKSEAEDMADRAKSKMNTAKNEVKNSFS